MGFDFSVCVWVSANQQDDIGCIMFCTFFFQNLYNSYLSFCYKHIVQIKLLWLSRFG